VVFYLNETLLQTLSVIVKAILAISFRYIKHE